MSLRVYNTLTRTKEDFVPLVPGFVRMYCCGPTVYDHAHIGHAKLYVAMDVVVRYLRSSGYSVKYVQNITDVGHLTDDADSGEDKVERRAAAESVDPMELVDKYTNSFFEDMDALKVRRPSIAPRASAHIPEQIQIIQDLINRGSAYEVDGSVYFDVTSAEDYGKLSGRRLEDMEAGARVEVDSNKRHPGDFLLWRKAAPEHILKWPSPWGIGYPGWHIECSAMAKRYLGETFDIHGGGLENMFPHNEDEIAQSEAANCAPFARYWIHVNTLTVGGQKMGKSLGNAIYIKEALGRWSPEAIRFFILSTHYRSVLDVTEEALDAAETGLKSLTTLWRLLNEALAKAEDGEEATDITEAVGHLKGRFRGAMDDDFNTSAAMAALFDFRRELNTALGVKEIPARQSLEAAAKALRDTAGDVLGILKEDSATETDDLAPQLMDVLISTRSALRKAKQFELADRVRTELADVGVELEDRAGETVWRRKS
ncbi:MAG: cysteine--tRNA ligase [Armatimonadetes bacterium]|nr:cysteine--tRNA ligase [Armatimonadota bacterium]